MTTARNMMHLGVECVPEHETLDRAAQLMREHNVGSLPICSDNNRLTGIITDLGITTYSGRDGLHVAVHDQAEHRCSDRPG